MTYWKDDQPTVSVITVCYNAADTIEETINSVIVQTYPRVEYIIIDGGSTDKTVEIIKQYSHHISYWESTHDNGIYDAMNKGASKAGGQWINFLNSGDSFASADTIEKLFQGNEGHFLKYGNSTVFSDTISYTLKAKRFTFFNLVLWGTRTLCHQAMFVKVDKMPFYDTRYRLKGELNWYFDILKAYQKGHSLYLDIDVVRYRLGGVSAQNVWVDTIEQISLVFRRAGLLVLFSIPVLLYRFFVTKLVK